MSGGRAPARRSAPTLVVAYRRQIARAALEALRAQARDVTDAAPALLALTCAKTKRIRESAARQ
jgi:hypothetical protein